MAWVIDELPDAIADRRCCDATLRQGDSCSADGQGFGILELVGSHRHRQLWHARAGGGEQGAAAPVMHSEVNPGQNEILADEALYPD